MKEQQVLLGTEAIKLTLGRTSKFIPPPWYKGGGGGKVDRTPPRSFGYIAVF